MWLALAEMSGQGQPQVHQVQVTPPPGEADVSAVADVPTLAAVVSRAPAMSAAASRDHRRRDRSRWLLDLGSMFFIVLTPVSSNLVHPWKATCGANGKCNGHQWRQVVIPNIIRSSYGMAGASGYRGCRWARRNSAMSE